ncbi:MAG: siphovirus Gp157 family protein [Methylococcaceae bacterium]|nr:siphovirus Gp157 family protein [Methylococcaceae bacterium]
MSAIYEISARYQSLLDRLYDPDLPEDCILDTLEGIEGEMADKAENIAALCCELEATAAAIKEAETRQKSRRQAMENKASRLRKYLLDAMAATGNSKFETSRFRIAIRQNPEAVIIDDEAAIPGDYYREIPARMELDKAILKQAMKDGFPVPGAHLERGQRLEIR